MRELVNFLFETFCEKFEY